MITVADDRNATVSLRGPARRVVSLVPSTTETVEALAPGVLVGVTRYCVHPASALLGLPRVGGTKDASVERIAALEPDVVLANAEENTRELFAALEVAGLPLVVAFPRTVDDALRDLERTAALLGVDADPHLEPIHQARVQVHRAARPFRFAWLVWRQPWMAAGHDTFVARVLAEAGGVNVFGAHEARYPVTSPEDLLARSPGVVLLPSEPFPFRPRHAVELAAAGLPSVRFADGELTWHGVRLARTLAALAGQVRGGFPTQPISQASPARP